MGQSPSADLYWGFDLGDMTDPDTGDSIKPAWMGSEDDEKDETEWREAYAMRLGWKPLPFPENYPETDYREPYEQRRAKEEAFRQTPEYLAYSTRQDEMRVLTKNLPVELVVYGYDDEASYCVRVTTSVQWVSDWGSKELAPLVVGPEWHGHIMRFMEHLDLPVPDGKRPGWHLNCSYG